MALVFYVIILVLLVIVHHTVYHVILPIFIMELADVLNVVLDVCHVIPHLYVYLVPQDIFLILQHQLAKRANNHSAIVCNVQIHHASSAKFDIFYKIQPHVLVAYQL